MLQKTSDVKKSNYLYWLDWLRFSAAMMVLLTHARGGNWVEWRRLDDNSQSVTTAAFFACTRAGTEWVLVFFVLSGCLVGGKLIERLASKTFNMRDYMIDRVSRIWVPLVPALAWSAIVAVWVGKSMSFGELGYNLLGLQGVMSSCFAENIPLWSLAYEIWFYVLAASVGLWVISSGHQRLFAVGLILLSFVLFTNLRPVFLFAWLLGAGTFWLCKCDKLLGPTLAGGALLMVGFAGSQIRSATVSVDTSRWRMFVPSEEVSVLLFSTGVALIIPVLGQLRPRKRVLCYFESVGSNLAAFSYTLYLTHYPTLYIWEHYVPHRHVDFSAISGLFYALRVISCLAFAWICYLPFEKQTRKVRDYLRDVKWHVPKSSNQEILH